MKKHVIASEESQVLIRMKWKVPPRLAKSWSAWNGRSYNQDYLYPSSWPVTFNLCSSIGLDPSVEIVEYDFRVQGEGNSYTHNSQSSDCRRAISVPKLGEYRVTVRARTQVGWSRPYTEIIEVKDWLIAIIGDSMSSGEGNPDQPGDYDASIDWLNTDTWVPSFEVNNIKKRAKWKDRRCHRSALSGPVLAAKELEKKDPHSSVTLIDLACSGAEIFTGLLGSYEGIAPNNPHGSWWKDISDIIGRDQVVDHRDLPPQVKVLEDLAGTGSPRGGRRIDALLMSIGVNDVHFSDVVMDCAKNINPQGLDCIEKFHTFENIARLENSYKTLADRLEQKLNISEVYIAQYPPDPIGTEGCGWLDYPAPNVSVSKNEARAINTAGNGLNIRIRAAARDHGWNHLEGMLQAFDGHAYCDDPAYFVGITESLKAQGIQHGALHPNRTGHEKYRDALLDAIVLRPQRPHKRVTITITQIRIKNEGSTQKNGAVAEKAKRVRHIARDTTDLRRFTGALLEKEEEKRIVNDTIRAADEKDDKALEGRAGVDHPSQSHPDARPKILVDDDNPPAPPPSTDGDSNSFSLKLRFLLNQYGRWPGNLGPRHLFTVQKAQFGQWVDLPEDEFTFTLDVYPEPASSRHPVGVGFVAGSVAAPYFFDPYHTVEDNYGEGPHQVDRGGLSIRYTIEAENLAVPIFDIKEMKKAIFKIHH